METLNAGRTQVEQANDLLRRSQLEEAFATVNAALTADPSSVEAHHTHIAVIEAMPESKGGPRKPALLARARKSADALVFLEPNNARSHVAASRVGLLENNHDAARRAAAMSVSLAPRDRTAHELFAEASRCLGVRIAPEHVVVDPSLSPGSAEHHTERAVILSHYRLSDDALASVNAALTIDPTHAPAHIANIAAVEAHRELINPSRRRGLLTRVEQSVAALNQLQPEAASTHEAHARAHLLSKDYEAARTAAERALALEPGRAEASRVLGDAHKRLGNVREAGDAYLAAAAADPSRPAAPAASNFLPSAIALPGLALFAFGLRALRSAGRAEESGSPMVMVAGMVLLFIAVVVAAAANHRRKTKVMAELS